MTVGANWLEPNEPGNGEGLAALRDLVVAVHPEHAGSRFRLLQAGWDCLGLDVDDRFIFKIPRNAEATTALEGEARLLNIIRPAVTLAVPELLLFRQPRLHSRHAKLPGEHLLPNDYEALGETKRADLAEDLAGFLAELHAIPVAMAQAAGAAREPEGPRLEQLTQLAVPLLPERLRTAGFAIVDAFFNMSTDPLGEVLGHFDLHGWNMAWDHTGQRLNGLYDFGDAGLGGPHLEFVAIALISADLEKRVMASYRQMTGRSVDPDRVAILTAAYRLQELAAASSRPTAFSLVQAINSVQAAARMVR